MRHRPFLAFPHLVAVLLAAAALWVGWRFSPEILEALFGVQGPAAAEPSPLIRVVWAALLSLAIAFGQEVYRPAQSLVGAIALAAVVTVAMLLSTVVVGSDSQSSVPSVVVRGVLVLVASLFIHAGRRMADRADHGGPSAAAPSQG